MKKLLIPFLSLLLAFQVTGTAEAQTNARSQNPDELSSTVTQLSGEVFGTDSWSGEEEDTYEKAFDGEPYTFFDAHETSHKTHVGIAIDSPAKLTEVRIFPRFNDEIPSERHALTGTEGVHSGENFKNLIDFDLNTKWCISGFEDSIHVIWEEFEAVEIYGYKMYTGNDNTIYPGRNPISWTLYGSNNPYKWNVIDVQTENYDLPEGNYEEYFHPLDETAPAYKYYKLEITDIENREDGICQLSEFLLLYNGCRNYFEDDISARTEGITIEGSVNGIDWIPIYRFPDVFYSPRYYTVTEDMFASAAHQYSFTQFRLTNPQNHLNVAEVEFIGTYEHDLPAFPVVIEEPIYSYYTAEQFLNYYSNNYYDLDRWYFEEYLEEHGMTRFEKDFEGEEPIALLGGAGFNETEVVLDRVDGRPVFAVMPWAFSYTNGIREVTVGEDSSCRYIFNDAFRGCKYLEYVTVSNAIYDVWFRAFAETPSLKKILKIDAPLSDEEMSERPGRYAEVIDDALIVTTGNTSFLNCYPSAKEYTETFTCPENVTILEQYSLYEANIGKITITSDIAIIDVEAFTGCQAHTIEINANVERIHEETFLNMSNLEKVIFRGTLTEELNLKTFSGCSNLQEIEYHGDSLTLFYDKEDDFTIGCFYDENENLFWDKFCLFLSDPQTAISLFLTTDYDMNNRDYYTSTHVNNPYFYTIRGSATNFPGDINDDGQINGNDYLILNHYTSGCNDFSIEKINFAAADIDGDGILTAKDRMILARYLAKWPKYNKYFN